MKVWLHFFCPSGWIPKFVIPLAFSSPSVREAPVSVQDLWSLPDITLRCLPFRPLQFVYDREKHLLAHKPIHNTFHLSCKISLTSSFQNACFMLFVPARTCTSTRFLIILLAAAFHYNCVHAQRSKSQVELRQDLWHSLVQVQH